MATRGDARWPACHYPTVIVASAATLIWAPPSCSLIGWLTFVLPALHRKSLSWNTLRARKRAEARDASSLGVRGQENGLVRKPKDGSSAPPPLASPVPGPKAKVSMSGRRCALVMWTTVCGPAPPAPSPARLSFSC